MYGNQLNNIIKMTPHNQSSIKGEQMLNLDYFMSSIINILADDNTNNIPSLQKIIYLRMMLDLLINQLF